MHDDNTYGRAEEGIRSVQKVLPAKRTDPNPNIVASRQFVAELSTEVMADIVDQGILGAAPVADVCAENITKTCSQPGEMDVVERRGMVTIGKAEAIEGHGHGRSEEKLKRGTLGGRFITEEAEKTAGVSA